MTKSSCSLRIRAGTPPPLSPLRTIMKVKLVLANHKMVHESLARSYGYQRVELWPANIGSKFAREPYERMVSILYEEPQVPHQFHSVC